MKQKHYSYNFHPMSKLHEHIGYHGGIQGITFLGNQPNFKIWWYFEILTTWEVNWKNHKMCNILKTAGHGAKQMLGGGGGELHVWRVIRVQFQVNHCTLQKISDVNMFKRLLVTYFSSNFNQTLQYYFFWYLT